MAVKKKEPELFTNVVLLMGGFHQAHNFSKAVMKIMWDSGEELIITAELCSEGTAKKIFGERANYYQSLHTIYKILNIE